MSSALASDQRAVVISDSSQIGEARRVAAVVASEGGCTPVQAAKLAIVVTELAANIVLHTKGGQILLQAIDLPAGRAIEVLAMDNGPGMADPARCMEDNHSTGGTRGNGLGAVLRQSQEFDLYSQLETGTVLMARISTAARWPTPLPVGPRFGAVSVALRGETICGDAWRLFWRDRSFSIIVADGLGHGPQAAEASRAATDIYDKDPFSAPQASLRNVHGGLTATRGAAVAVAVFDREHGVLRYAGLGNIAGSLLEDGKSRGLLSRNGTAGAQVQRIQELEYPWSPNSILVMHSDGVQSRWQLNRYPGLTTRHPGVIAGVLYRDFQRSRDDATVVVVSLADGV